MGRVTSMSTRPYPTIRPTDTDLPAALGAAKIPGIATSALTAERMTVISQPQRFMLNRPAAAIRPATPATTAQMMIACGGLMLAG